MADQKRVAHKKGAGKKDLYKHSPSVKNGEATNPVWQHPEGKSIKLPGQRLAGEKIAAYEAFRAFLSLGPTRTYESLIPVIYPKGYTRASETVLRYSYENKWESRASEWDAYQATLPLSEEGRRKAATEARFTLGKEISEKVKRELESADISTLKDLVAMADKATAMMMEGAGVAKAKAGQDKPLDTKDKAKEEPEDLDSLASKLKAGV